MCCCSCCYKRLPTWYILLAIGELICGIIRLATFFPLLSSPMNEEKADAIITAGFILDWIGSLVPTFMGIIIGFVLLIVALKIIYSLCCNDKNKVRPADDPSVTLACSKFLLCSRPMNRFVALNCNFPCYIPRPRLRFIVRLVFLLFSILLRIIAIILYATSKTNGSAKALLAIICTISLIFPILAILLDIYQYRIWWHYRPSCDKAPRQTLSRKHVRYIPYHLVGNNRNDMHMGNKPCDSMGPNFKCPKRSLEHLIIFHLDDYKPQERWGLLSPNEATTYVGFHRTTAESAVAIAHSDFRQSMKGSQMLGFGVYFARSIARTEGKARFAGALICAEIRMGRVKEVTFDQLYTVRNSNAWWTDYDTVYYNHKEDDRDEFCVKDPAQILKWVIVVDEAHDTKVNQYGLGTEFEDTFCHCI
ncbi:unnamed protein product [Adineta steineri]|uniref:PARP catalytic domain-containing protein n=1 Tax=Adineta steineri TaxID=433720 RepID=A0A818R445_9BILA|nr:unnamed protein product [Adineta steineri]CAF1372809.1 unnamed protein product [Adineta steineri]CAF3647984.1 unnamed protein product [Adineta steineri]CAF3679458.1 unnamed protein product [Adineta steineri]